MRVEYDEEADAAYFYVEYPIQTGSVKKTLQVNEDINIDFDKNGKILGIEILSAKKLLMPKLISDAVQIGLNKRLLEVTA